MRLVLVLLLFVFTFSQAIDLSEESEQYLKKMGNFEMVRTIESNDFHMIVDELVSLEYNMFKVQITTFSGEYPAYDIISDFTEGKVYYYFNLTDECHVANINKMNLTEYVIDLLKNHTEYAGHRGEHLGVFEMKHPEEPDSRTWIYGMWFKKNESSQAEFIPTMYQAHHPEAGYDESGEFKDTISFPTIGEEDFSYSACKDAKPLPFSVPSTFNPVRLSSNFITKNLYKSY